MSTHQADKLPPLAATLSKLTLMVMFSRDWKFKHPKRRTYSIRTAKVGNNSLFSKEVLYTLFLTNVLSLLLGTGFGYVFHYI